MVITAKYCSRCPKCDQVIDAGSRVNWAPGQKASHISCPAPGQAVTRSFTPQRSRTGKCQCGACEDLMSFGYQAGQRVRCVVCGGWAEAC